MKIYIVFDTDDRSIQRIYTNREDFLTFFRLYADNHCTCESIDTKNTKLPSINEEVEQRWAVQFDKKDGKIIDIIRGVSIKDERIDNLLKRNTTHIFVNALTRYEAIDKAQKIYDNGKD